MSLIVAELGPTNTGKTHRAIERMLEHESGMIGLPLRLLAREVYDRVTARVGEARVALITGEEKRVPRHPSYWICTVEAMPVEVPVDFLAVDEIQLCAHRERGHVFTDRLLHARGRRETWFLGADTLRPALKSLLPEATVRRAQRLSQLRGFGKKSLKSLPPRSAVIAFSTAQVYELAESVRRLRGGVAVVLGGLSPRTRNAQVAMYQSGEVQYLVATDAIGMGLNLDLDRVAFASLSKFDGFEQRALAVDELAQIAGRAGRHLNDGAFGTLGSAPELDPRTVSAIEAHRFPPIQRLVWRSSELDFSNADALLDSLSAPPANALFSRVERADDFDALRELSRRPQVQELVRDPASLRLLWEVCQIPDFRKRLFGEHVVLLEETFLQLAAGDGQLREEWLRRQVGPLDDTSGDIHVLTDRLSAIRIWTYVSQRGSWVPDAQAWQERTRRIEDALGDALHARLVERFVDRAAHRSRRRFATKKATPEGPFAKLGELSVGEALTEDAFVQQVVDAPHDAFDLDAAGKVHFEGEPLARLVRGPDRLSPQVVLVDADAWSGGARRRLEQRFAAFARDVVAEALGGFPAEALSAEGRSAPLRALAYRFTQGLGIVRRDPATLEQCRLLDEESRARLEALGVREGQRFLIVVDAVSPLALERRCLLTSLHEGQPRPPGAPAEPFLPREALTGRHAEDYGYEWLGPVALRIDALERVLAALSDPAFAERREALFRELGLDPATRMAVLRELMPREHRARSDRQRRRARKDRTSGSR